MIDGRWSVVFDEAENRLHAQAGILAWVMGSEVRGGRSSFLKERTKELLSCRQKFFWSFFSKKDCFYFLFGPHMTESIRLVIWDLDEAFWHGTLTEGGMRWRPEAEQAVRTLAARGIISAICSKNDPVDVKRVLAAHRMRRFFVFNSISWESKGPRRPR